MSLHNTTRSGSGYRSKALLFAGGLLVGLLAGQALHPPRAEAQIPDAGLQRRKSTEQAAETNRLLMEIVKVLRTETLKVRVVEPDKAPKGGGAKTRAR